MVREIDLTSINTLGRHEDALRVLGTLTKKIPATDWCLIGGFMTELVLREQAVLDGKRSSQTKDADVVVEITTGSAHAVVHHLLTMGFSQLEKFLGQTIGQARYHMGDTLIDVLGPDDTADADLVLAEDASTLAAPGGRRALEVSSMATVYFGSAGVVDVRLPSIAHAVVVKSAAALDPKTKDQPRHLEDVVDLLRAIERPADWASTLSEFDISVLEGVKPLVAPADREATAALRLLMSAFVGPSGEQQFRRPASDASDLGA